jgi:membrane protease YdiL (CAAX protease family)
MTATVSPDTTRRSLRPFTEAAVFVAVWMGLGFLLPGDPNLYLLIGIPLTVAFQLLVRRRPLRAMWVDGAPRAELGRGGRLLAAALSVMPVLMTVQAVVARAWVEALWGLAALAGALPAAYAITQLHRRRDPRTARHWLLTATTAGVVVMLAAFVPALLASGRPLDPVAMLLTGVQSTLLYLPVGFVLEEVVFRGVLDPHLEGRARGIGSAVVVSLLWGAWHLPVAPAGTPVLLSLAQLLLVHGVLGVPLSLARRRTGGLAVPAAAHALIDGVRNALTSAL